MRALLLLAGRSTRFWPLTEKTLFPLCGKTLLEHQVERLQQGGCTSIILVGGAHNLEDARRIFPDVEMMEQEDLSLGMRGALLSALPTCGTEPVMIVGGNDVIEPSAYTDLIAAAKKHDGALLAQKVTAYFPGGYLQTDGERIVSIVEKPGEGNEPSDLVNIVAHVHNHPEQLLKELQKTTSDKDDGYECALDSLFKTLSYTAVPYSGVWLPVKYPWHLLPLTTYILSTIQKQHIHPSVEIHPSAVIDGPVIIEEGTKVMPHAIIRGPAYIGKNCVVANNALVRGSSIGDNCVVGYCTEVKGSVLHSHVWTHMTYIGDSIIGSNVSFGAGSVTGNYRLDEGSVQSIVKGERIDTHLQKFGTVIGKDCRFGIQSGINPGVKVGSGSFVSSGVLLSEDVPEKSFVSMKDGSVSVRENKTDVPQLEGREKYKKGLEK